MCMLIVLNSWFHENKIALPEKISIHCEKLPHTLADTGFFKTFLYQGGVKFTVFWVFEDLKFKISEGYEQNWCFPDSAQLAVPAKLRQLTGQSQENTNFGRSLLKF